jgi:hypothetical protein
VEVPAVEIFMMYVYVEIEVTDSTYEEMKNGTKTY